MLWVLHDMSDHLKADLLHALCTALPFVEDALEDPCYKPDAVRRALALIQHAITNAEKIKPC